MIDTREIFWAAGFLEGEGYFAPTQAGSRIVVNATQKQREPLERLQRLFGGHLRTYARDEVRGHIYHRWDCSGRRAASVAMTLYTLMSPRRQEQIREALAHWRSVKSWVQKRNERTHCKAGHELAGENLYVNPEGTRQCQTCKRQYRRAYYEMERRQLQ